MSRVVASDLTGVPPGFNTSKLMKQLALLPPLVTFAVRVTKKKVAAVDGAGTVTFGPGLP